MVLSEFSGFYQQDADFPARLIEVYLPDFNHFLFITEQGFFYLSDTVSIRIRCKKPGIF